MPDDAGGYKVGDVYADLTLRGLDKVRADLDSLGDRRITVTPELDEAKWAAIRARFDKPVGLKLDTSSAEAKLTTVEARADKAFRPRKLELNTEKVKADLTDLNKRTDYAFRDRTMRVKVVYDDDGRPGGSSGGGSGGHEGLLSFGGLVTMATAGLPVIATATAGLIALGAGLTGLGAAGAVGAMGLSSVLSPLKQIWSGIQSSQDPLTTAAAKDQLAASNNQLTTSKASYSYDRTAVTLQTTADTNAVKDARLQLAQATSQAALADQTYSRAIQDSTNALKDAKLAAEGAKLGVAAAWQAMKVAEEEYKNGQINNVQLDEAKLNYQQSLQTQSEANTKATRAQQDATQSAGNADLQRQQTLQAVADAQNAVATAVNNSQKQNSTQQGQLDALQISLETLTTQNQQLEKSLGWASPGGALAWAEKRMQSFGPAGKKAADTVVNLAGQFGKMRKQAGKNMMPGVSEALSDIEKHEPAISKFSGTMSTMLGNDIGKGFDKITSDPAWVGFWHTLSTKGPGDVQKMISAAGKFATGFASLFTKIEPDARKMIDYVGKLGDKFENWGKGKGSSNFLSYVQKEGPKVVHTIGQIASGAERFAQAVKPISNDLLTLVDGISKFIKELPPGALEALTGLVVGGFVGGKAVKAGKAVTKPVRTVAHAGGKAISFIRSHLPGHHGTRTGSSGMDSLAGVQKVFVVNWPVRLGGTGDEGWQNNGSGSGSGSGSGEGRPARRPGESDEDYERRIREEGTRGGGRARGRFGRIMDRVRGEDGEAGHLGLGRLGSLAEGDGLIGKLGSLGKASGLLTDAGELTRVGGIAKNLTGGVGGLAASILGPMVVNRVLKGHSHAAGLADRSLAWGGTGAAIGSFIPGIGTAVGAGVGAVAGAAYSFVKDPKLRSDAVHLFSQIGGEGKKAAKAVTGAFGSAGSWVGKHLGVLDGLAGKHFGSVGKLAGVSGKAVQKEFGDATTVAGKGFGTLNDLVHGRFGKISSDAKGMWSSMTKGAGDAVSSIGSIFSGLGKVLSGLFGKLGSTVSGAFHSVTGAVGGAVSGAEHLGGKALHDLNPTNWFATGGQTSPGMVGVGDGGPEILALSHNAQVVSNRDIRRVLQSVAGDIPGYQGPSGSGSAAAQSVDQSINITVTGQARPRDTAIAVRDRVRSARVGTGSRARRGV